MSMLTKKPSSKPSSGKQATLFGIPLGRRPLDPAVEASLTAAAADQTVTRRGPFGIPIKSKIGPEPLSPTLPTVDLLPPEVKEQAAVRRSYVQAAAIGAVAAVGLGALWFNGNSALGDAEASLAEANAQIENHRVERMGLIPVEKFLNQATVHLATVGRAGAYDVSQSAVMSVLRRITPPTIAYRQFDVSISIPGLPGLSGPTGAPMQSNCPNPDPFNASRVSGCASIEGSAESRADIAQWITALQNDKRFTDVFVSTTASNSEFRGVAFSATIGFTDAVFPGGAAAEARQAEQALGSQPAIDPTTGAPIEETQP